MWRWLVVFCLLSAVDLLAQGPKAAYAMNEATGVTTADTSGNGNTGTLTNGPTHVVGKYSNGINFDGINDFVTVPDSNTLDVGNTGTIEAWVKFTTIGRWNAVIAKGTSNNDNTHNYALETDNLNKWHCVLGSGTANRLLVSTVSVVANTWYHVACAWTGTTLQMYINGALHTSVAQNLVPAVNAAPLTIGQFGGTADQMAGVIDEVRIYNRALTAAEITTDMNTPVAAPPPVLGIKISGGTVSGGAIGGAAPPGSGGGGGGPPQQHAVDLSWTASPSTDVSNYNVYRSISAGGPYGLVATVGVVSSYSDATVVNATTYYYVITATSPNGESVPSNEATAVIP